MRELIFCACCQRIAYTRRGVADKAMTAHTDQVPVKLTVQKGISFNFIYCFCGRSFRGRDMRRVRQHHARHARRCTVARRVARELRKGPPSFNMPPSLVVDPSRATVLHLARRIDQEAAEAAAKLVD